MVERIAYISITFLSLRFFYGIVQTHDPGSTLFSWHPTCMILGQIIALESIFLFKYIPRGWRVTIHGLIAGLATTLFCFGFYAIYQNKVNLGKEHFTSWHGIMGVSTVAVIACQSLFGNVLKYGKSILQRIGMTKLVKVGHRVNGLISMMLTFIVVMLVTGDWLYCATVAIPSTVFILRLLLKKKDKKVK